MPKYMLLLHDDPSSFGTLSPADIQTVIEKYMAWGKRLRAAGIITESNKLTEAPGRVMRGQGSSARITDGPYSETKEVLGGYYIIVADSYDEAAKRAADCPQLEYGGTIEIREVDVIG